MGRSLMPSFNVSFSLSISDDELAKLLAERGKTREEWDSVAVDLIREDLEESIGTPPEWAPMVLSDILVEEYSGAPAEDEG
jgi:hypothetical protein